MDCRNQMGTESAEVAEHYIYIFFYISAMVSILLISSTDRDWFESAPIELDNTHEKYVKLR